MRILSSAILSSVLLSAVLAAPAFADDWRGHGDIHRFHEHDYGHWREGRWNHGFHEGHEGWWWVIDGTWYNYPAPVYPYPDPYMPPEIVVQPAPTVIAPPSSVYYCPNPAGYYPYVPRCYTPWQKVAANASAPTTVIVQQAPAEAVPAPQAVPQVQGSDSIRDTDDRRLNALAAEFQNVDLRGARARAQLRNIEKKVEAFRQTLYTRSYNAMDILRDAENLQHRIAAQRASLAKHRTNVPPAMPPAIVPPAAPQ